MSLADLDLETIHNKSYDPQGGYDLTKALRRFLVVPFQKAVRWCENPDFRIACLDLGAKHI